MPNVEEPYEQPTQPLPRYRPEDWAGESAPAVPAPVRAGPQPSATGPLPEAATGREIPTFVQASEPPATRGRPVHDTPGVDPDRVPTPQPMPIPRPETWTEPRPRRAPAVLWAMVLLALLLSAASLAVSGVLVYRAMAVRQKAVDGLDMAISGLESLGGKGFQYNYRFKRTIPFSGDIPFKQELTFPFEGDIPINTTVQVPVDAGVLGTFQIKVPINTKVHIQTSVPIRIDETFHVNTEIPVDLTIPIDIRAGDPAIQELISPIREWLVGLRDSF